MDLLNDVEVLPVECVETITDYPNQDEDLFGEFMEHPKEPVCMGDIASGKVEVVILDEDIRSEGAARHMYTWKQGALVYRRGLADGHWLHAYVRKLDDETVQVEVIGERHSAAFRGCWVWVDVTFCEGYRITVGGDSVEIRDYAMYEGEDAGENVLMPADAALNADVLTQVSSFKGEYDDFEKTAFETDSHDYRVFLVANSTNDPAIALKQLLPDLRCCPALFGKRFVVSLDSEGMVVAAVEAA